jgi:hypothetical protein
MATDHLRPHSASRVQVNDNQGFHVAIRPRSFCQLRVLGSWQLQSTFGYVTQFDFRKGSPGGLFVWATEACGLRGHIRSVCAPVLSKRQWKQEKQREECRRRSER